MLMKVISRNDIEESHMSSWHGNKLLVYNAGIPKTRMNNPNAKKFVNIAQHPL